MLKITSKTVINFVIKLSRIIKISLIVICFSITYKAEAKIKINKWRESIELTQTGKRVQLSLAAKAVDLKKNYHHNSFTFIFDPNKKIIIKDVHLDNNKTKYSFKNNHLKIYFNKNKSNNDYLLMHFTYKETYNKIHQFLRQEAIQVPSFAHGADVDININFLNYLESVTLNSKIKEIGNKFIYRGKVPKDGIFEIVKLTPSKNIWNVTVKNSITNKKGLGNLRAIIPFYFQNGVQILDNYQTTSNPLPKFKNIQGNNNIFHYNNINTNKIDISSKATIYTGKGYRPNINHNPQDYLQVSHNERMLLTPILKQIKEDPRNADLPLYAKIGRFVHNFIKYDKSYIGKKPKISQIISQKTGVCTEYSNLYNKLARMAKIPSMEVVGVANGKDKGFEGHSWNLIYHNRKWIHIDPTWDLMSGTVSSSHIYFCNTPCQTMSVKISTNKQIKLKNDFEVIKIH